MSQVWLKVADKSIPGLVNGYPLLIPLLLLTTNIAEDASAILSPQKSFVNVVECSSRLLQLKENAKKK